MLFKNFIDKIGKERLIHWIYLFSLGIFLVGIFEFFYIWIFRFSLEGYSRFSYNNYTDFRNYLIMFIQVYGVLFIPLTSFIGYKYRNSIKFNSKNFKILVISLLIVMFSYLGFSYHAYGLWEWTILFMIVFILVASHFNLLFAFSFSYLCFYGANMLFEFQGLNFLKSFGTFLAYLTVFGILVFTLYRLKIKIFPLNYFILAVSFSPLLFYWVWTFPIWQLKGIEFSNAYIPLDLYYRLFTFPLYITVSIVLYFTYRKHGKSYILKQ